MMQNILSDPGSLASIAQRQADFTCRYEVEVNSFARRKYSLISEVQRQYAFV
jgi:hypothetical protein